MGEPEISRGAPEVVEDALADAGRGDSDGLSDGARPLGTDDTVTVHLPKSYTAVWPDAVRVRGGVPLQGGGATRWAI